VPSLTEQSLFDPLLPASFAPVLENLREFGELVAALESDKAAAPTDPRRARISELHLRILYESESLLEPEVLLDLSDQRLAQLFARSVLFLLRLKESVTAGERVLDTAGSRTLALYESDFYGLPETPVQIRRRLRNALGLSAAELSAVETEVERDLADARYKKAVISAVRDEFDLRLDSKDLIRSVHRLFQFLFPGSPLVPGEAHLVLTGAAMFFCLPIRDDELTTPRYGWLNTSERDAIKQFIHELMAFSEKEYRRFPAVGNFSPERLDKTVLDRLAGRAGMDSAAVARELDRAVTVLALADVDKFVIHDVWGHGWEASMLRFDDMYRQMADYGDPLNLDVAAGGVTLRGCFSRSGAALNLDAPRFRRFVLALAAERLPVTMSGVLSEMMADVMEFGFVVAHPERADEMPSSSLFKVSPTKLDLTLDDVQFFFDLATAGLKKRFGTDAAARELAEGLTRTAAGVSADNAVAQAREVWRDIESDEFVSKLRWKQVGEDQIAVNAFARLALNFVGIHRAIVETYQRIDQWPPGSLPPKSYKDLLLIGASVFFEDNRARNLWRVDEYLTLKFAPLCRKLGYGP
jgi:hypothetical protein